MTTLQLIGLFLFSFSITLLMNMVFRRFLVLERPSVHPYKSRKPASKEYIEINHGFIVVDTTRNTGWSTSEKLVMPFENPHTYKTLDSAIEQQVDIHYSDSQYGLHCGYDSNPETIVIFKLVPVPLEEVYPLFEAKKIEMKEDYT